MDVVGFMDMDDMSWSSKHPADWSSSECHCFMRSVAEEEGREVANVFRPYDDVTGLELCQWRWQDFFRADPYNGILFHRNIKAVLESKLL